MHALRLPSVSLEESVKATTRVEQALLEEFPDEIDTVISKTGRPEVATDPMGVELSDIRCGGRRRRQGLRDRIARYGINASDVLDAVAAMGGRPVGEVFEVQRPLATVAIGGLLTATLLTLLVLPAVLAWKGSGPA